MVVAGALFHRLEHLDRGRWHDGGDRVLVNELRMAVAAQQYAEIVEPGHKPLQFDAIDEENRNRCLALTHMIEKCVLQILRFFRGHEFIPFAVGPLVATISLVRPPVRAAGAQKTYSTSDRPCHRRAPPFPEKVANTRGQGLAPSARPGANGLPPTAQERRDRADADNNAAKGPSRSPRCQ